MIMSLTHHIKKFMFRWILSPFGSSWFCKQLLNVVNKMWPGQELSIASPVGHRVVESS